MGARLPNPNGVIQKARPGRTDKCYRNSIVRVAFGTISPNGPSPPAPSWGRSSVDNEGPVGVEDDRGGGMAMQFTRVVNPVEHMEIWNASSEGFSFAISYETRNGPGFHGPPGYVASWCSLSRNSGAIRVSGSPFKTLAEAEEACNAMLGYLTRKPDGE
jgi:hypothetical protein